MARAHEIGIAADTKGFESSIRDGVVDPLEDAEKALEQLADAADDAGRDGARGIDRLEDALKDAQRQAKKTEDAVDDAGTRGFGKMGDAAQEVTQEVGQNLGEAVSSVRGNLADLGQVGQDTLGGLAATLASGGPAGVAGAAAVAAGAVGLGLITAEMEKQNEKAEQLREFFVSAWQAAIDAGNDYIDTATIAGQISEIALGADWADERNRALEVQRATGLDLQLIYRALAGDMGALGEVSAVLNEAETVRNQTIKDTLNGSRDLTSEQADQIRTQHDAIVGLQGDLDRVSDTYSTTQDAARVAAQATSDYWLAVIEDAGTATQEVDEFHNTLLTLPDGQQVLIDAETGLATTNVEQFKGDVDGIPETVTTTARFTVDRSEVDRQMRILSGTVVRVGTKFVTSGDGWD